MHEGHEALVRDIAKILHIAIFLNGHNDLAIAQVTQPGQDGHGAQDAQATAVAPFFRVVERDEAINDGLPRDQSSQQDQVMGAIGQMGLDPLIREEIFSHRCLGKISNNMKKDVARKF